MEIKCKIRTFIIAKDVFGQKFEEFTSNVTKYQRIDLMCISYVMFLLNVL